MEAIAKASQNIKWEPKVDGRNMGHKFIRRVSIDKFYEIVTGQEDAFYQMCMVLPETINKAINDMKENSIPNDTVYSEIKEIAKQYSDKSEDLSIAMAFYLLGFSTYSGFDKK